MKTDPGEYCGVATINKSKYEVYTKAGHFGLVTGNRFHRYVKCSDLRKAGIFCP